MEAFRYPKCANVPKADYGTRFPPTLTLVWNDHLPRLHKKSIYHSPLTIRPEPGQMTQHRELPVMALTCANTTERHDPERLTAP